MATGGGMNTDILSDETFDLLCTMCKRKGRNREAEKFCVDCHDYYCFTCVKVHEDVPSLSGHKVLDRGQFPSRSGQSLPMAPTERCEKHSHKHVDMYCENHDDVGCSTCMAVDHRLCQSTFYIPDYIQNLNYTSPRDIEQKLDFAKKTLTEQQIFLQREKQRLLDRKAESREGVKKFRKEVNDRLDKLEEISLDEIERKYATLIDDLEERLANLKTNSVHLKTARDNIVSSSKNVSQTFVNVNRVKHIADNAAASLVDNKAEVKKSVIEFSQDQKLIELLAAMNSLGPITQKDIRNGEPSFTGTLNQDTLLQIKEKKAYSIKTKSDKFECRIVSACAVKDGTIILSDNSNKTLKRLHGSTYTVTDCLELSSGPWQVCPTGQQEVAVCIHQEKELNFISLVSRMTKTKEIKTDFNCYGLAYVHDNLYISDGYRSVYVYSVSGRKLRQFSNDQSGQALFSDIRSLTVNVDGSTIYVADLNKGLITINNNGQLVRKVDGTQIQKASSCNLTARGNVLICGLDSNNVLQFKPDGSLLGKLLKSGMSANYEAICCNQQMSKMIVGGDRNDIEVYDLK